ncbi:hypothetical protein ABEB36_007295 [Hypothenemus hampei]|uniref:Uncharacterized protein n=1 Tax=Hypothenemus hampei TaxID=57062 RepID=A0ABD1EU14_HYPHA
MSIISYRKYQAHNLVFFRPQQLFKERQFEGCKTPVIKNGKFRSRQRGRVVRFYCNPGYFLAGERTLFCSNAMWEEPIPKCVRATCKQKVNAPKNGLVLQSNVPGMVNFYCQQGYVLNGPAAAYCDGVVWDVWNPSCIPTHEKPSFFCDFEDENICHWTHDISHDMEWTRDNFKTPSGYSLATGPSHDHTKGNNSNGHYMYIESSSKRTNDTARLVSPIFSKINNNVCLEFWYHMYGTTTGTLRAYVRKTSEPWPPKPEKAVFSKSGNQGNHWYQALVNLGNISEDFQIVMEGVRGPGYVSDIAIDDVRVIPNCIYAEWIQITTYLIYQKKK